MCHRIRLRVIDVRLFNLFCVAAAAARANIYSSNSEDEESEEDERNRKRLLKAKKLDSDKVSLHALIQR